MHSSLSSGLKFVLPKSDLFPVFNRIKPESIYESFLPELKAFFESVDGRVKLIHEAFNQIGLTSAPYSHLRIFTGRNCAPDCLTSVCHINQLSEMGARHRHLGSFRSFWTLKKNKSKVLDQKDRKSRTIRLKIDTSRN